MHGPARCAPVRCRPVPATGIGTDPPVVSGTRSLRLCCSHSKPQRTSPRGASLAGTSSPAFLTVVWPSKSRASPPFPSPTVIRFGLSTLNDRGRAQPPEVIAQLYRLRWRVELFFKWIKQNLRIRHPTLLRHQRQRGENLSVDRHLRLRPGRDRAEGTRTSTQPIPAPAGFERERS